MISKKIAFYGLVIAAALLNRASWADSNGYYLDNFRLEVQADPKTHTASGAVKVTSNSQSVVHIRVIPKLWTIDEDSVLHYIAEPATGYNLLQNLLINPREFDLKPGSIQWVRFMARLPGDVTQGEYPFQLMFSPESSLSNNDSNNAAGVHESINVIPVFSTTIYTYLGKPQPKIDVKNLSCSYQNEKHQILINTKLINEGSKHARLQGRLLLNQKLSSGQFKSTDLFKIKGGNLILVFPDIARNVEEAIPTSKLAAGEYRIDAQFTDERQIQPAIGASCSVTTP